MKTSKIIFVSLLTTITVLILTGFIVVRIAGRHGSILLVKKHAIQSFNAVYLNNCRATIVYDDSLFIGVSYRKDSAGLVLDYKISNDTLRITDNGYTRTSGLPFTIHANDSLNTIVAANADLTLVNYGSEKLSLNVDKSSVLFDTDSSTIGFSFRNLDITARNHSYIRSNEIKADKLQLFIQSSEANIQIVTKSVSGILSDESTVYMSQSNEISLKKDDSSKILLEY